MAISIYVNCGETDVAYGTSGSSWYEVTSNDYLVFSAGSDTVKDGEAIPSESQLISAGTILSGAEQTVGKYFLADVGSNVLREIHLMGNQNTRYVVAFDFSDATASEPTLHLYDDSDYDSIDDTTLGAGTAANSWWRGIVTTSSLPGTNWTGTHMAGSGSGYYLNLNGGSGALSGATTLYCNLKVVIPSSQSLGGSATPVFVCKYNSAS